MEWLNLTALLLIALSNVFIGIKVKNQVTRPTNEEKFETLRLQALHLECALKNALQEIPQPKAPVVTVLAEPSDVSFDLDYEKLGAAIKKALMESQIAMHNAQLPVVVPNTPPEPRGEGWWSHTPQNESVLATDIEIEGTPAKQFPRTG